jgi:hypothetical protein
MFKPERLHIKELYLSTRILIFGWRRTVRMSKIIRKLKKKKCGREEKENDSDRTG